MDVRPIESPRDLQGVNRVNVLAWRAAYDGILPADVLDGRDADLPLVEAREQYDRLRDATGCFLVAEDDAGEVRGYVYVRWGDDTKEFVGDTAAGLKEIYVHPDDWGEGVGSRLLDRALAEAPESVDAVRLEMLADNDVAAGFYESRGFRRVHETEFELDGDAYPTVVYEREL
ncbi:GNAT family N-acetyltransferase [Halobacterium yunchengense]|uniref:GNAT family N-acetyltransferase n=1 Tax=Halobacterium yunchengense TaxID=3108497 RepID=UPI003009CD6E